MPFQQLPASLPARHPTQQQKLVLDTGVDQRVGAEGRARVGRGAGRRAQERRLVRDELRQELTALGADCLWGSGGVRSGQVRSGQVGSDQIKAFLFENIRGMQSTSMITV